MTETGSPEQQEENEAETKYRKICTLAIPTVPSRICVFFDLAARRYHGLHTSLRASFADIQSGSADARDKLNEKLRLGSNDPEVQKERAAFRERCRTIPMEVFEHVNPEPELDALRLWEEQLLPRLLQRYPKGMPIELVFHHLRTNPKGFDEELLGTLSDQQINLVIRPMMLQLINDSLYHYAVHLKKQLYQEANNRGITLGPLSDEEARTIFDGYWTDFVRASRLQ
jgi:hypothetical protein